MREEELRLGTTELSARLARYALQIVEQDRPWPHLMATYFELGKVDRHTSVVIPDEFLRDLPRTKEYKSAVDSYAEALVGRIQCGSPNTFYCLSDVAIETEITWPIQAAMYQGMPSAWLRVNVSDMSKGTLARCVLNLSQSFAYSGRTIFDDIRVAISRIRHAIDTSSLLFYNPRSHPDPYQQVEADAKGRNLSLTQSEIERYIAGKTYNLAFRIPDVPGETWVADPWDAEYLSVTTKELAQSAHVLRARKLIEFDASHGLAKPSDKFLTLGWPGAIDAVASGPAPQVFELAKLPKKEQLVADLKAALAQKSELALIFIDLDRFKEVNDTKGHMEGDHCLHKVVGAIGAVLGRKGTLYRWGGDEFAMSLPNFSTEEALVTAERVRKAIEEAKAGDDIPLTASIGVCATDRLQNAQADELLDSADKAMYTSKHNGKNQVNSWPTQA